MSGPCVRLLNCGGIANPDVLLVHRPAASALVVKDYSRRPALVRRVLVPLLMRHELNMLERARGLPGVPAVVSRIDALAFAMERVDGAALSRRAHRNLLRPAFFAALEGILAGLQARGLLYTDLRSPSNILHTPTGAPALVDLASAVALPVPPRLRAWFENRALAKLRDRFEGENAAPAVDDSVDIDIGRERLRVFDRGRFDDPVPLLCIPDAGLGGAIFARMLERAEYFGRRAIVADLPGFGRSRRSRRRARPADLARDLQQLLDVMRLDRVDVFGYGFGGSVAIALAARCPALVRSGVTFETPLHDRDPRLQARRTAARHSAAELRARLLRDLPRALGDAARVEQSRLLQLVSDRRLRRVVLDAPAPHVQARPAQPWAELEADPFAEPDKLWLRLAALLPAGGKPGSRSGS